MLRVAFGDLAKVVAAQIWRVLLEVVLWRFGSRTGHFSAARHEAYSSDDLGELTAHISFLFLIAIFSSDCRCWFIGDSGWIAAYLSLRVTGAVDLCYRLFPLPFPFGCGYADVLWGGFFVLDFDLGVKDFADDVFAIFR